MMQSGVRGERIKIYYSKLRIIKKMKMMKIKDY